jgi:hypothetical protein
MTTNGDRIDAVPEADFVEQAIPAHPDVLDEDAELELPVDSMDRDAAETDVIDQAIAVPVDEYSDDSVDY